MEEATHRRSGRRNQLRGLPRERGEAQLPPTGDPEVVDG